jgi:hypothetical protein
LPADTVWLLSQDKIYEIRLGARTVRTLIENRPGMVSLQRDSFELNGSNELRLIVRTTTGASVIDPVTLHERELEIGPPGDAKWETLWKSISRDESGHEWGKYVVASHHPTGAFATTRMATVSTLDADGHLLQREEVSEATGHEQLFTNRFVAITLGAPTPVGLVALVTFLHTINPDSKSIFEYLNHYAISLLASMLIGLMTGWAAWRREREVFGEPSWFWPVLVGLCGWFGWVAYICLRPLPARLSNRSWMSSTPDAITPIGIEIFG